METPSHSFVGKYYIFKVCLKESDNQLSITGARNFNVKQFWISIKHYAINNVTYTMVKTLLQI